MRTQWKVWLIVAALAATSFGGGATAKPRRKTIGVVRLVNATGGEVGFAVLFRLPGLGVLVTAMAEGLPSGFHGFHIHQTGNCTPPDFASAGGHHNPGAAPHGAHAGDLPVLMADSQGRASTAFHTDRFTLESLFDADGSAMIVHQAADNYANIPPRYTSPTGPGPDAETLATGDAGARLACGVIKKRVRGFGPLMGRQTPLAVRF